MMEVLPWWFRYRTTRRSDLVLAGDASPFVERTSTGLRAQVCPSCAADFYKVEYHMRRLPVAIAVLRAFLPPAERDEVVADLTAELTARIAASGQTRAVAWLWMQLLRSIPSLLRRSWWRGRTGFDSRANVMNPGGPR